MDNRLETRTSLTETCDAILDVAGRAADVVRRSNDASVPVPGLDWTLGEAAAHLAAETREYAETLTGDLDVNEYLRSAASAATPAERSAALNVQQLDRNRERDPLALAAAVQSAAQAFAAATATRQPAEQVRTTNGLEMTVDNMARVILGEYLVHGLDIARATKAAWRISPEDALRVADGVMTLAPKYLDPEASRDVTASYGLRFRGGPAYKLSIDRGSATVGPASGRVDCTINADPVAFLLVGYGRASQWGAVMRGKLIAFGRKPWLGFKFGSLLTSV